MDIKKKNTAANAWNPQRDSRCETIRSIATEMGKQFEVIVDSEHQIAMNRNTRDEDTIYLYEPGERIEIRDTEGKRALCDASVFWKDTITPINWDTMSKDQIQKELEDAMWTPICVVCKDPLDIALTRMSCPCCEHKTCMLCRVKLSLTPKVIRRILLDDFGNHYQCPGCQVTSFVDVRDLAAHVVDKWDQFTMKQQRALKFIAEHGGERDAQRKGQNCKEIEEHFKKGARVKVIRTKDKQWKGKRAKITGERIVKKDGTIRWPVQLLSGPKLKASIKQSNLRIA